MGEKDIAFGRMAALDHDFDGVARLHRDVPAAS